MVDEALFLHLDGHPQRGRGGALADARLQDEEATLLDGELDVAHVAVVVLQRVHDLEQLRVTLGERVRHRVERLGDADAGDDVFTLRVAQEVAVRPVLAGRRVTGERDTGAGVVALVPEHHGLHVDGGAEVVGDLLHAPVVARALAVPAAEHRFDRAPELLGGVLRELDAGLRQHDRLEPLDQPLQVFGRQLGIARDPAMLAELGERVLELLAVDVEHDLAEHLHEPAVGVVREPRVATSAARAHRPTRR